KLRFPVDRYLEEVTAAERAAVKQIEKALDDHPDEIAALIIEPIQGEGGDNHFRPEFLQKLRDLADQHEFLFIADEVQTGVGLTGKMWAYQHFGITPDVLVFGKKTQVCGILAGRRVDEVEKNVFQESTRINSTWGGNLTDMVRFGRYLEIIEEEKLVERARQVGAFLLSELEKLQGENPDRISNVRGRGLMCAFDLQDTETRDRFKKLAFENGMLILGSGRKSMRFRPTLSVGKEEVEQGIGILRRVLSSL
ncbi:MAG TPA: aminotransferase class III-fold pyridoxal phosphate-dependent enzyme, partial [Vicinamibacteria bacterium]|nr:aminotransferase class III-fold pyridoxal phosphate-dependent enzyme [Vicinamibacteria bacterium]